MEGTGEGCGFFCSPKFTLFKYNVSTILSPIVAVMQGSGHQYQETKQDGGRYGALSESCA